MRTRKTKTTMRRNSRKTIWKKLKMTTMTRAFTDTTMEVMIMELVKLGTPDRPAQSSLTLFHAPVRNVRILVHSPKRTEDGGSKKEAGSRLATCNVDDIGEMGSKVSYQSYPKRPSLGNQKKDDFEGAFWGLGGRGMARRKSGRKRGRQARPKSGAEVKKKETRRGDPNSIVRRKKERSCQYYLPNSFITHAKKPLFGRLTSFAP